MINSARARWHTTTAACRDRTARELSKWSRATLAVTIGFGTFLMLLGCLFTYDLAMVAFRKLERGGFFVGSDFDYRNIVGFWAIVLLLLYGGDFIRAGGWRELRRRRPGAAKNINASATASAGTTIVGMLLAPVLLFWGASGVISFVRAWQFLLSRPAWARPSWAMLLQNLEFWSIVAVWWLLTMAWLVGGVILIWRVIHALDRRPASSS